MNIVVTIELDDEYVDSAHPMGITDEGYLRLAAAIADAVGEVQSVEQES